jgi:hypothetical protein
MDMTLLAVVAVAVLLKLVETIQVLEWMLVKVAMVLFIQQ